jgi:hypothetical protein
VLFAIAVKKKNFTTKSTKTTKRERKTYSFQAFVPLAFFVFFVSSWFYLLEFYRNQAKEFPRCELPCPLSLVHSPLNARFFLSAFKGE